MIVLNKETHVTKHSVQVDPIGNKKLFFENKFLLLAEECSSWLKSIERELW